jgi:4-hydroxybenzoate polyprenyltransferase
MGLARKLEGLLKLGRIEHSIMLDIAVLAAILISDRGALPGNAFTLLMGFVSPFFISYSAFAINDYFDIKVDKINKKSDRPLVNGTLRPATALYATALGFAIGIISSYFINPYCFAIAAVFAALAFIYSYRLKEIFLLGNIYIALTMVIPFVFGGYIVDYYLPESILLVSIMIFFSGLAREIHGTIRDMYGDMKARKAATLPTKIGWKNASLVALLMYMISILASAYLFLYVAPFRGNPAYAFPIFISDIIFLYVSAGYLGKSAKFYGLARNLSLMAMLIAIVGILIAPLYSGILF